MEINKESIKKLASLSRLDLNDAEAEEMTSEAKKIVSLFDDIKNVDVSEIGNKERFNISESVADRQRKDVGTGREREQFRDKEKNMLKVLGVFGDK